ncbi:hypothetical protein GQ43DRAFT_441403 [Delitschia confertaspora ATCC 74209]|uniref:Uncharacterized protein n=1 Tax=Delitschia confertaspora ATCC 74209 TaxID=1513339 RepID=A0A9P4JK36_9PLEO|nr:hypothetical protein GQ43DRAFT_441403 [Delitschia confertaspora ATCC 74209]
MGDRNTTILEYTFDEKVIQDAEDVYPVILPSHKRTDSGLEFSKTFHLGPTGGIEADISDVVCDDVTKFHVNVVFNLDAGFYGTQVLAECQRIPFTLELLGNGDSVKLVASTRSAVVDWRCTDPSDADIRPGIWHSADLVYDGDTLTLFLDHRVVAFHGFGTAGQLYIRPYPHFVLIGGGQHHHHAIAFSGTIAKFELEKAIPEDLEKLANQHKTSPEWHITTKLETLRNTLDLGLPTSPVIKLRRLNSWWQTYTNGALMYHSSPPTAFSLHGTILDRYTSLPQRTKESLGYLISDEQVIPHHPTGRKSEFQGGAIYSSPSTSAFEVYGEIYHDFDATGEIEVWGFPLDEALPATGGLLQQFQKGTWYYKYGTRHAYAVRGDILKAFVATGGLGRWGYPVFNEVVVPASGREVRLSQFEKGSFYWSKATGAHAIEGSIKRKWLELGGPDECYVQELGLPMTEEMDVSGKEGARISGFENGAIICCGGDEDVQVVYPFQVFLRTVDMAPDSEKEEKAEGANDVYQTVIVNRGDETIFCRRYEQTLFKDPEQGYIIQLPTVRKPEPGVPIRVTVDVWDQKKQEHIHLGKWEVVLDESNAWGLMWKDSKMLGSVGKLRVELEVRPLVGSFGITARVTI